MTVAVLIERRVPAVTDQWSHWIPIEFAQLDLSKSIIWLYPLNTFLAKWFMFLVSVAKGKSISIRPRVDAFLAMIIKQKRSDVYVHESKYLYWHGNIFIERLRFSVVSSAMSPLFPSPGRRLRTRFDSQFNQLIIFPDIMWEKCEPRGVGSMGKKCRRRRRRRRRRRIVVKMTTMRVETSWTRRVDPHSGVNTFLHCWTMWPIYVPPFIMVESATFLVPFQSE